MAITLPALRGLLSRLVEAGFDNPVVAGGVLRDLTQGVEVKDIDVFVGPVTDLEKTPLGMLQAVFDEPPSDDDEFPFRTSNVDVIVGEGYAEIRDVVSIYEVKDPSFPVPIQVIELDATRTLREAVERMDFGICQIGASINDFCVAPAFVKDANNETFTVMPHVAAGQDLERSKRRFTRLSEKYPGWRLVVPEIQLELPL